LGSFLFSGDDVEKRIKVLSGGEKARVALAKTIVSKGNFLLLDEPTNHLDMHSVELLADALNKYEGSYILVSHDRYFISKTANKIWEISDHRIKEFKGGYHEWVAWNERMAKQNEGNAKSTAVLEKAAEIRIATPVSSDKKESQPEYREKQKQLQREKKKLQELEVLLEKSTSRIQQLESAMGEPENYAVPAKFAALEKEYSTLKKELAEVNKQLESVVEKVLTLEDELG